MTTRRPPSPLLQADPQATHDAVYAFCVLRDAGRLLPALGAHDGVDQRHDGLMLLLRRGMRHFSPLGKYDRNGGGDAVQSGTPRVLVVQGGRDSFAPGEPLTA